MSVELDIAHDDEEDLAHRAVGDPAALKALVDATSGENRRLRGRAAVALELVSREHADLLVPYTGDLADALHRPEARTRWSVLDAFTRIIGIDSRGTDKAVPGAEASLFDEESGQVRTSAFVFLTQYGSTTEMRSAKVWPLIDEAIQCYHGDPEFTDMLNATLLFASGKLAPEVRTELAQRMKFDAENSKGPLGRRARQIIDATAR